MSGLKQLRNRVKSISSTQKITKAMQVVSAAKLKKLKDQAEQLNDFSEVLGNIMHDISTGGNLSELPARDRMFFSDDILKERPKLLIVMSSERGLCGGFNSQVLKKVKKDIEKFKGKGQEFKLIVVGKKGHDVLKGKYSNQICGFYHIGRDNLECVARQVRDKVIEMIESGIAGETFLYYNFFKNAMTQIMTRTQILPAERTEITESDVVSEYEYEGDGLVRDVINLYLNGQMNYGLLQSRASEEGARMTAMDNATRNAGDLIDKLTLKLNRSRQAIITTELTEIISGAEAV